jgi:hypothetical protein
MTTLGSVDLVLYLHLGLTIWFRGVCLVLNGCGLSDGICCQVVLSIWLSADVGCHG